MKKLYLPSLFLTILCFSSCFDIEESYDFKADGSCKAVYSFDLGKTVAMFVQAMTDSAKRNDPQFKVVLDTTINFYSGETDDARQKMTAEQANLAKNSNLNVKMDLKNSIMKASIMHFSKNSADLNSYVKNLSNIPSLSQQVTQATKSDKKNDFDSKEIASFADYYTYEIAPHKFYRTVDPAKFNAFATKNKQSFDGAKSMNILIPYKITLNFPNPVKSTGNSLAILSADRKSVIITTNMAEINKNPSIMNLKIDY